MASCQTSTHPFHLSSLSHSDRGMRWKGSWVETRTLRSLTNYQQEQNRLDLGKINFIYSQLKTELDGEKQREKLKCLPFISPFFLEHSRFNFTSSVPTPLSPASNNSNSTWGRGVESWSQSMTAPLCPSFLYTLLPCPSMGPPIACSPSW